jgi:anti-sigma factor RsiW
MECRDVREMADSFLSGELLTETNHEILRHLDACSVCRTDIASRRALRGSLKTAFDRSEALKSSAGFRSQLHGTLRSAAFRTAPHGASRLRGWLALAAMALLTVGLAGAFWALHRTLATEAFAEAAVGDHRNCALEFHLAEKPISIEAAAQRFDAAFRILHNVPPDSLTTGAGPARVVERHSCVYDGRRFAHIVLQYRDTLVSLLVMRNDSGAQIAIPDEARLSRTERVVDSMSVVSLHATHHVIFLVGDVAQRDLAQLADAIAGPLVRQLAEV